MHILEVFLKPQDHELGQRYVWQIFTREDENKTVLRHGSANSPINAVLDAVMCAELEGYAV